MRPLLSIIIINFNYYKFLKKSIQSCTSFYDKYNFFELILIDDGSTDESKDYIYNLNLPYLKKYYLKNVGIEKAINFAVNECKGKFFSRLDSDDFLHESFFHEFKKNIKLFRKYDFLYSNYFLVDKKNKFLKKVYLPLFAKKEIFERGDFLASGTILKKNIFLKFGGYNTEVKNCGLENYELILKIINSGSKGKKINKFLFSYRRHSKSLSIAKKRSIQKYGDKLFKQLKLGKFKQNLHNPHC